MDKAATGAYIATRIVQENRGWIIARFGDSGRKFIDYTELVNNAMMIYGGVRLVTSLGKLVANWKNSHKKLKDLVSKEQGFDDDQLKIVKKIDDQVEEVTKHIDELLKSAGVGRYKSIIKNGKPILGGFEIRGAKPYIRLFKGADEATFVHEFVHFRHSRLHNIKTQVQYLKWAKENEERLEAIVDSVIIKLGF